MLQGLDMDSNSVATLVTACATAVYGIGTIFLVYQLRRDRVQRDRHFQTDSDAQKLTELRRAFYEAYGYWLAKGIGYRAGLWNFVRCVLFVSFTIRSGSISSTFPTIFENRPCGSLIVKLL